MNSAQMMKNQMQTYFKCKQFFKLCTVLLLINLLLPTSVLAQAKEPWQGAYTTSAFAGGAIRDIYCDLVGEVEGSFGALQFVVGGIMAFGFAVFGDVKKTYSIFAAGVVGATMSTGVSLYFGQMCDGGSGGGNNQRSLAVIAEPASLDLEEDSTEELF